MNPPEKVLRKKLSNDSDPAAYEDLSGPIRSGMLNLGYNLTDPLGIALDLVDEKVEPRLMTSSLRLEHMSTPVHRANDQIDADGATLEWFDGLHRD